MTTLKKSKLNLKRTTLPKESSLPFIKNLSNVQQKTKSILDEDDELFIGYGFVKGVYPHKQQDDYSSKLEDGELETVELENDYLKAIFVPCLGGRLWSLFDKKANKELLFANKVFRPANLSVRNAWFAGGVEWNSGIVGHHPYTCGQVFTATLTASDKTPVLRIYEFDRIRHTTWQCDFFLPENSKMLLCRMRINNPLEEVVPMYWWSNIAVNEDESTRVIVDADDSYTNRKNMVSKTTIPKSLGIDVTYPANNPAAIDFFFHIPKNNRKYICNLDKDGYGLVQTSTSRLQGRKLFVWGQTTGSASWQSLLAGGDETVRYAEIQAGLAHTQYECLPMPPKTAWEWLEGYGAMQADKTVVHGDWKAARKEASKILEEIMPEEKLEAMLLATKEDIGIKKADEILFCGTVWGALETMLLEKEGITPLSLNLDFGAPTKEQEAWVSLLQNGTVGIHDVNETPQSWQGNDIWIELLNTAIANNDKDNWYAYLQLGTAYIAKGEISKAKDLLLKSINLKTSCWALYALSQIDKANNNVKSASLLCQEAFNLNKTDPSLAKEVAAAMFDAGEYDKLIEFYENLPEKLSSLGRIRLQAVRAFVKKEEAEKADKLFFLNGGLDIADMREGEISITELWLDIEELKAKKANKSFDRAAVKPPKQFEYRTYEK